MRRLEAYVAGLIDRMAQGYGGPVAVAVSGGSDSLSLLHFASRWAARAGRELLVLSVDHGLRPEAAEECEHVTRRAAKMGHAAQILTWTESRKGQAAARRARHALLAEAARQAGAGLILLGHTRNDVEETLLMRLARPAGLAGAVGPQPVSVSPVWPDGRGVVLARPLAGLRREALRDWLSAQGETWVEDPSNEEMAYERVRARALLKVLPPGRLERIAGDAALFRAVEDVCLSQVLEETVHTQASGLIEVRGLPERPRVRHRFLGLLLLAASGGERPAPRGAIARLDEDLRADDPATRHTLGGAWIQRRGSTLMIGRDPGEYRPGWADGVWDGRYVKTGRAGADSPVPFLVRHAVPPQEEGWREIISGRLGLMARTLRDGARLGAELAGKGGRPAVTTIRPG